MVATAQAKTPSWTSFQSRGGPTVRRILLGAQLRRLRERRGISAEDAGYEIRASHSKISRMELGRVGFKERDVADLLTLYGVTDPTARDPLLELARDANSPGWWQPYGDVLPTWFENYLGLEEAASVIRGFELRLVPELLQSEDYTRAVIRLSHPRAPEADVEQRIRLRATRQERFVEPGAPKLWAVVDEAVLHRPIGGRRAMRGQLAHLAQMAKLPNVTLQIVPSTMCDVPVTVPFTILRFPEAGLSDVVYMEQLTSAMYLDKRADVDAYQMLWDEISVMALQPEESVRHLQVLWRQT
ncbi:helix-turn-helix transcriptional regulator [Spirillospora sp. NPDC052269]